MREKFFSKALEKRLKFGGFSPKPPILVKICFKICIFHSFFPLNIKEFYPVKGFRKLLEKHAFLLKKFNKIVKIRGLRPSNLLFLLKFDLKYVFFIRFYLWILINFIRKNFIGKITLKAHFFYKISIKL